MENVLCFYALRRGREEKRGKVDALVGIKSDLGKGGKESLRPPIGGTPRGYSKMGFLVP